MTDIGHQDEPHNGYSPPFRPADDARRSLSIYAWNGVMSNPDVSAYMEDTIDPVDGQPPITDREKLIVAGSGSIAIASLGLHMWHNNIRLKKIHQIEKELAFLELTSLFGAEVKSTANASGPDKQAGTKHALENPVIHFFEGNGDNLGEQAARWLKQIAPELQAKQLEPFEDRAKIVEKLRSETKAEVREGLALSQQVGPGDYLRATAYEQFVNASKSIEIMCNREMAVNALQWIEANPNARFIFSEGVAVSNDAKALEATIRELVPNFRANEVTQAVNEVIQIVRRGAPPGRIETVDAETAAKLNANPELLKKRSLTTSAARQVDHGFFPTIATEDFVKAALKYNLRDSITPENYNEFLKEYLLSSRGRSDAIITKLNVVAGANADPRLTFTDPNGKEIRPICRERTATADNLELTNGGKIPVESISITMELPKNYFDGAKSTDPNTRLPALAKLHACCAGMIRIAEGYTTSNIGIDVVALRTGLNASAVAGHVERFLSASRVDTPLSQSPAGRLNRAAEFAAGSRRVVIEEGTLKIVDPVATSEHKQPNKFEEQIMNQLAKKRTLAQENPHPDERKQELKLQRVSDQENRFKTDAEFQRRCKAKYARSQNAGSAPRVGRVLPISGGIVGAGMSFLVVANSASAAIETTPADSKPPAQPLQKHDPRPELYERFPSPR